MLLYFVFPFKNSMPQTPSSDVDGRPAGLVLPTARGTEDILSRWHQFVNGAYPESTKSIHIFIPHFFKVRFIFPTLTIIVFFRPPSAMLP